MTRDVFIQIDNELDAVDEYLGKLGKKYGYMEFNGREYILYAREELDTDYDGKRIWTGCAVDVDSVQIEELVDDAERLKDIDITVGTVTYTKNEWGEVTDVDDDFWFDWDAENSCLKYKLGETERRIA